MAKTKILKTKVVGAKVTEQEYDKISAVAEKRDKSVSQLVRERLLAEQLPSLFEQGGNIGRIKELESKINNQKEIIQKQDEKIQSLYVVINDLRKPVENTNEYRNKHLIEFVETIENNSKLIYGYSKRLKKTEEGLFDVSETLMINVEKLRNFINR